MNTFILVIYLNCALFFNICLSVGKKECYGFHEIYRECGPACPPSCFDLIEEPFCNKEDVCVKGCFCRPGYMRDAEGRCVLPKDCFPKQEVVLECNSLEVFERCDGNCENTCDNYGTHFTCPRSCKAGCVCKKGYVRNEQGFCIPPQYCRKILGDPKPCNSSLEDFHFCFAACQQTCDNFGEELDCNGKCKPGCICKSGLVRDQNNNCILPKYCKSLPSVEGFCGGPHEVYSCGSPCDIKCNDLGESCKKFSFKCTKKCYCKKGYARDHRNICIPIRKCPKFSPMTLDFFLAFIQH